MSTSTSIFDRDGRKLHYHTSNLPLHSIHDASTYHENICQTWCHDGDVCGRYNTILCLCYHALWPQRQRVCSLYECSNRFFCFRVAFPQHWLLEKDTPIGRQVRKFSKVSFSCWSKFFFGFFVFCFLNWKIVSFLNLQANHYKNAGSLTVIVYAGIPVPI